VQQSLECSIHEKAFFSSDSTSLLSISQDTLYKENNVIDVLNGLFDFEDYYSSTNSEFSLLYRATVPWKLACENDQKTSRKYIFSNTSQVVDTSTQFFSLTGSIPSATILVVCAFCCICVNFELVAKVCFNGTTSDISKICYLISPVVQIGLACITL
jgi:hypothetical protein